MHNIDKSSQLAKHPPAGSVSVKKWAEAICQNPHLEHLFLEYLRYTSTEHDMKSLQLRRQTHASLGMLTQLSLDAFLVEANRFLPVYQLNGQLSALIDSVKQCVTKKYKLDIYFNLNGD